MNKTFLFTAVLSIFLINLSCASTSYSKIENTQTQTVETRKSEKSAPKNIKVSAKELEHAKNRITKVLFHSSKLWVLGQNGVLLLMDLERKKASPFQFAKFVADIYVNEKNEFYVLASNKENAQNWQILQKNNEDWFAITNFILSSTKNTDKDEQREVVGLTEFQNRFLVLTKNAVYTEEKNNEWKTVKLQTASRIGLQTPFAATDDGFIYYGLNLGEFGGGLWRIDLKDGSIKNIEKKATGKICFLPLYSGCDPVTSVIKNPNNPNSILAAVGLRHFSESGRVLLVKNNDVSVIFNKVYDFDINSRKTTPELPCQGKNEPDNLENFGTEAVFGMQSDGKNVWLVTGRAVYKILDGNIINCEQLPSKLEDVDGILISESIKGVILVGTDVNWAKSLSGTTPLIAVKN